MKLDNDDELVMIENQVKFELEKFPIKKNQYQFI